MGLNSSSTADLAFESTPAERLGEPGNGMRVALRTLDGGRIGIGAQAVGIAQAALDLAAGYAKERNAFGGPIARLGAIQQKLADMQTEIEAARALVWRAARLKEAGRPHTVEGAQAKLFASAVARRQTGEAIQILGGYGYTTRVPRRALLPRRQGHRDLRGHERDPAPRHRPRPARRGDARRLSLLSGGASVGSFSHQFEERAPWPAASASRPASGYLGFCSLPAAASAAPPVCPDATLEHAAGHAVGAAVAELHEPDGHRDDHADAGADAQARSSRTSRPRATATSRTRASTTWTRSSTRSPIRDTRRHPTWPRSRSSSTPRRRARTAPARCRSTSALEIARLPV